MDFIFTGIPKKRELIIYLLSNEYSLLRNLKLKKDILKRSFKLELSKRNNKLFLFKLNVTNKIDKLKQKNLENNKNILQFLKYINSPLYLKIDKKQEIEINMQNKDRHNKFFLFENLSDDEHKTNVNYFDDKLKVFSQSIRSNNLKNICRQHDSKLANFITENKNLVDLNKIETKNIDFNFTKPQTRKNKDFVLTEIINVKKKKKNSKNDYYKILKRNTILNSGYENIKIIPTYVKNETKKITKERETKIKWDLDANDDVHNLKSPVPILKRTKYNNVKNTQKRKEIVFLQNIDTYEN